MSTNIKRQVKPLLYIDQPKLPYEEPKMQTIFQERVLTKNKKINKERSVEKEAIETSENATKEIIEATSPEKDVKRRFKDFSLEEKINHFIDMPFHVPKPPCEVTTNEKIYKGYLIRRDNEFIILQTPNKAKTIPIKEIDITDVKLYGL